jgi:anti-sigma factor RsiW
MQRPSDERLIAYLDGELPEGERAEVEAWLERDAELRERAGQLSESAALLRAAFDETLHEPLPERLIAAARGETGTVINLAAARQKRWKRMLGDRRWWIGVPVAASLLGLFIGTGVGYFAVNEPGEQVAASAPQMANPNWLDAIALDHKLLVNAGTEPKLPSDLHVPNLKPWGLAFQRAHTFTVEGQPATQLFYTTDNKALGPLTVVVANTSKPDLAPAFAKRDEVNLLYWRHHGHAYALVGTADIGYLWNIHNDIAYQLDAI